MSRQRAGGRRVGVRDDGGISSTVAHRSSKSIVFSSSLTSPIRTSDEQMDFVSIGEREVSVAMSTTDLRPSIFCATNRSTAPNGAARRPRSGVSTADSETKDGTVVGAGRSARFIFLEKRPLSVGRKGMFPPPTRRNVGRAFTASELSWSDVAIHPGVSPVCATGSTMRNQS